MADSKVRFWRDLRLLGSASLRARPGASDAAKKPRLRFAHPNAAQQQLMINPRSPLAL
jgi:hypothetical protein